MKLAEVFPTVEMENIVSSVFATRPPADLAESWRVVYRKAFDGHYRPDFDDPVTKTEFPVIEVRRSILTKGHEEVKALNIQYKDLCFYLTSDRLYLIEDKNETSD